MAVGAATASGGDRRVRSSERESRGGKEGDESERGPRRRVASCGTSKRQGGARQAGSSRGARSARAPGTRLAYWREVGDGAVASWARPAQLGRHSARLHVSPGKVFPFFVFLFYF